MYVLHLVAQQVWYMFYILQKKVNIDTLIIYDTNFSEYIQDISFDFKWIKTKLFITLNLQRRLIKFFWDNGGF